MSSSQWKPGESGNKEGGRLSSTAAVADVVKIARKRLTKPALRTLLDAMLDPNAPWSARIRAAEVSLERAWGPAVSLDEALRNATPVELERLAQQVLDMKKKAREAGVTTPPAN